MSSLKWRKRPPSVLALQLHPVAGPSDRESPGDATRDLDGIWQDALDGYRRRLDPDLRNLGDRIMTELEGCLTSEDILNKLENASVSLGKRRQGNELSSRLRRVLEPIVFGLNVILDTAGETISSHAPGGKGVFAAVAVLIKTASRVSAAFDDLENLFQGLTTYVERLRVRVSVPLKDSSRAIAVKALVDMLHAFELATVSMSKGRMRHFIETLFTKNDDLESALTRLADITSEEERMAIAEIVVGVDNLSTSIRDVGTHVSGLQVTVRATNLITQNVHNMMEENMRTNMTVGTSVSGLQSAVGATHSTVQDMYSMMQENMRKNENMLAAMKVLTETSARSALSLHDSHTNIPSSAQHQQLTPGPPARNWRTLNRMLRRAVLRFSSQDQGIILRAFATMLSWTIDFCVTDFGGSNSVQAMTMVTAYVQVAECIVTMAILFLLLFMTWRRSSISRPLGQSPMSIIIVDVLGEVFVLEADTFSTWENTHKFLLQAFQGRLGAAYVQRGDYGLGDSKHLLIQPESWSQLVEPGSRLNMSILVPERTPRCPYCHAPRRGHESMIADGRILCARKGCGRPYSTYVVPPRQKRSGTLSSGLRPIGSTSHSAIDEIVSSSSDAKISDRRSSHETEPHVSSEATAPPAPLSLESLSHRSHSMPGDLDLTDSSMGQFQRIVVVGLGESVEPTSSPQIEQYLRDLLHVEDRSIISNSGRVLHDVTHISGTYTVHAGSLRGVTEGAVFRLFLSPDFGIDDRPFANVIAKDVRLFDSRLSEEVSGEILPLPPPSPLFAFQTAPGMAAALHLHVSPSDKLEAVLTALAEEIQPQHRADNHILLSNEAQADLSVRSSEGEVEFLILNSRITVFGLDRLSRRVAPEPQRIRYVLRAASHFFWHLHRAPNEAKLHEKSTSPFTKLR